MNLTKNTSYMTLASIIQKIIAFGYFAIVARNIGVADTGKYFFALSFTTIFVVFVDLGFTNVMIREAARVKDKTQEYVSNVLWVKFFLGILTYIVAIITINLLGYDIETKQLVYVSGITMLFDSLHLTLYGVFRAYGDLKFEAIGNVGSQLLTLILGSVFLFLGYPLIFLMIAFLIPSVLNAVFAIVVVYKKYRIKLRVKYNKKLLRYIMPIVIPFALAGIFGRVYSYIDSVLLSKLVGDVEVGFYSVPQKIATAFQFIPLALVAAFYPRFSEYFIHEREKLDYAFHQGMKYLALVAIPISVGIFVLAEPIVHAFFSAEYSGSIIPLKILMIGLFFGFLNLFFGTLFNACNRQKLQTMFIGLVMIVNIVLNIILIPQFGATGAAIASIGGNIFMTLLGLIIIPRIVRLNASFLISNAAKIALSVLVMAGAVWYTTRIVHFGVAVVVGAIVYGLMIVVTKAVRKEQLQELLALYRK